MEVANSSTDPQMEVDMAGKHFQVATVREGQNVTFPGAKPWQNVAELQWGYSGSQRCSQARHKNLRTCKSPYICVFRDKARV